MNEVIELFSHYIGKVEQKFDWVTISNENILTDQDGNKHKVKCYVSVQHYKGYQEDVFNGEYEYGEDGYESTYSILGDHACPCVDLNEALKTAEKDLERFCFKRKTIEEIPLL